MSRVETLEHKITYLTKKLQSTRSSLEAAILSDQIKEARAELTSLTTEEPKKDVVQPFDVPLVMDATSYKQATRGTIVDTSSVIRISM